ncbi:MAG: hypothetical protein HY268_10740 [Deltaproteobacteria bacterium]|nr:hypothetical protein [Deltaproteobacteria bacterium]
MTEFAVQEGDVVEVPSDLLLLKYAQSFYGADKAVASRLISADLCTEAELRPPPGDFVVIETKGSIAPKRVLFLGTPPLRSFSYNEMEVFARRAVEKIVDLGLPVQVLTTTIHGTGYGLDGGEALQRLVQGFRAGLSKHKLRTIQRITFLTLGKRAERMLNTALKAIATSADTTAKTTVIDRPSPRDTLPTGSASKPAVLGSVSASLPVSPGTPTVSKRRVFVALPFSEEFQNVYEFGIYPAVRNCGFICERVDETHFTGDVLNRIRGGIEAADLVIADLTEGRPNVYLEVGYAWGRGVPVIFVAKKGEKLHFDVSTHRCIFYGKFTQFANDLEELIRGIEPTQQN